MNPARRAKDQITSITGKLADKLKPWTPWSNPEFELSLKRDGAQLQLISTRGGGEKRSKLKIVVNRAVSAYAEIVDYANDNCDMVVITTHGRSGS